ncbi:hypothetical protein [Nocardia tengchongensis]|uniref:hypothetical protein n=1 Tax=Nocardia tengchongensis TaxID=2055889 RepID=UPI0036BF55B0
MIVTVLKSLPAAVTSPFFIVLAVVAVVVAVVTLVALILAEKKDIPRVFDSFTASFGIHRRHRCGSCENADAAENDDVNTAASEAEGDGGEGNGDEETAA